MPAPAPVQPAKPHPKPRPEKAPDPNAPDEHEKTLRRLVKSFPACHDRPRRALCMLLHKAKAKALPTRETVLFNPIRSSWDGQVEKAVKNGVQPEDAGVMGLQFEEGGESARLFTIDATDDDEIPGCTKGYARWPDASSPRARPST